MKALKYIVWMTALLLGVLHAGLLHAEEASAAQEKTEDVDAKEVVLEHLADSYWWHIGKFGSREVNLPLPVILWSSESGWHCFSSRHLMHGEIYNEFEISPDGKYKGKIVELRSDEAFHRPLDLSITKTVLALFLNSTLLIFIMMWAVRWYRGRKVTDTPSGLTALMEVVVEYLEEDVLEPCVGKNWKKFAPYLLTVFFFILFNNLMGLIPFFPGGVSVTGNIAITFVLAFGSFLAVNIFGKKAYWKEIFWPDVPLPLKFPVPILPLIEFVGVFTRPFALMIRLFANMLAGHAVMICLVCVVFVTVSMGPVINSSMTVVSVLFNIFMNCLELLVAFLQAYVFTMLTGVFIGMAQEDHEEEEAHT